MLKALLEDSLKAVPFLLRSFDGTDLGTATGEMAAEILANGADVSQMEVRFAPQFTKEFNADTCAKLGITPPADFVAIG